MTSPSASNILWESSKHLEAGDPEPHLKANLLTLYSMRFCPYAQRTRLVLQHKGIKHQVVNVHLTNKPDWYLAILPSGKVPTLREPDGWIMNESLITSDYLDDMHPDEAPLYPKDPRVKARIRLAISKMGDLLIPAFYRWAFKDGDEQKAEWDNVLKSLTAMQEELGNSPYFGGCSQVQMADLMLWPFFERIAVIAKLLGFELPASKFGPILAWMERMSKEKAVIETRTSEDVHVEFFKSQKDKSPKYEL